MRTRAACVACGSSALDAYPAVLSPFIAERIGRPATACCLLECRRLPAEVLAGSVLDYGGDRGQFIPPGIGSNPGKAGITRVVRAIAMRQAEKPGP